MVEQYFNRFKEVNPGVEENPMVDPVLYELGNDGGRNALHEALTYLPDQAKLAPWTDDTPEGQLREAVERGIFLDNVNDQIEDLAKLTKPKDYYAKHPDELQEFTDIYRSDISNFTVVEYPWEVNGRFAMMLNHDDFYKVAFSRNRYIFNDDTQQRLKNTRFAIAGMGVGASIATLLVQTGAEKFTICDGGDITLHDFNRLSGVSSRDIGLNHAEKWARMAYQINPYAEIDHYNQNLAGNIDAREGELPLETFLNNADIVIEEGDSLPMKIAVRQMAKKKGIPVYTGTDVGQQGLVQIEDASTDLFHGRLTPDVMGKLQDPHLSFEEKTQIAAQVIIGVHNIPRYFLEAVMESQKDNTSYWPQVGVAAAQSSALTVSAIMNHLNGNINPVESKVDLRQLLSQ